MERAFTNSTKAVKFFVLFVLCVLFCAACSEDDDEQREINVTVAIRVDSHTPPSVTVFGVRIMLSNDNWAITQADYRQYEARISVRESALKDIPSGPLPTSDSAWDNIFAVQVEQGKTVFTLQTDVQGNNYLFILE